MRKVLINEKVPFGLRDASFAVLNNSEQQLEVLRARRGSLKLTSSNLAPSTLPSDWVPPPVQFPAA